MQASWEVLTQEGTCAASNRRVVGMDHKLMKYDSGGH